MYHMNMCVFTFYCNIYEEINAIFSYLFFDFHKYNSHYYNIADFWSRLKFIIPFMFNKSVYIVYIVLYYKI